MVALIPVVAFFLGVVLGWMVRQRLSLHYKQLWLRATALLEDKTLLGDDRDQPTPVLRPSGAPSVVGGPGRQVQIGGDHSVNVQAARDIQAPFVHGRWALDERREGDTVVFYAIRLGFDDVRLGDRPQAGRFAALYRRDRENAEAAVKEMNSR